MISEWDGGKILSLDASERDVGAEDKIEYGDSE
jgi:hypothetical protein